jgi:hypothetical protein
MNLIWVMPAQGGLMNRVCPIERPDRFYRLELATPWTFPTVGAFACRFAGAA